MNRETGRAHLGIRCALVVTVVAACTDRDLAGPTRDRTAPTVVATSPANGGVKTVLRSPITITFSEPMDAGTINSTNITIRRTANASVLAAPVAYDSASHMAVMTAPELIDAPSSYTVTVSSAVTDTAQNRLGQNFEFTFTAGDGSRPTVVSRVPSSGASGAATGTVVSATFSEPMDARFVSPGVSGFLVELNGSQLEGTAVYDSATRTASFTPRLPLQERTTYTVRIQPWVTDVSGMQLGEEVRWSFTTVDNTPPTAVVSQPPRGNTDIQPNAVVVVSFSEPMDRSTINASTIILRNTTLGVDVAGTITLDSSSTLATFKPNAPLTPGNCYRVTVTTGAKDMAGHGLRNEAESNFCTAPNPDGTRPTVTTTVPSDGQAGVATSAVVTARFSEQVSGVNDSTFVMRNTATGARIGGSVTYNGSFMEATFTPVPPLTPGISYTVTLTTAINDIAGNSLVEKTFTFTTAP